MRPLASEPAQLGDIVIPWFDTAAREPREAVLEGTRIAFADNRLSDDGDEGPGLVAANAAPLAGLAGFLVGLGLLVPGLAFKSRAELLALARRRLFDRDAFTLRRAARAGNAAAARATARRMIDSGRFGTRRPQADARLAALDRHLFASQGGPFDLQRFARELLKLRRA